MSQKVELAKKILLERSKSFDVSKIEDIKNIFDTVELFYREAEHRMLLPMEVCPKCEKPVKTVDLQGMYRVQCECLKGTGKTELEAFKKWMGGLD
jgi:hypothetical protein